MAFEPIEPQLKTVRSANRKQYSVSSFGTAAFSSPSQATSVTVNLGGRNIPQDDNLYPWTLDADGDVVFTKNTPSTSELVTITVDPTQQFLDFTKTKFPSGYSLDARVLNRTFLDALYTANILWTIGDDAITAWGESENVPIPTADDHFLLTESGGWKSKSLATTKTLLDIQTGDSLDLTNLKANSVSSTTFSAVDFQASSLSATNIHLEDFVENLVNIRRLRFDTDADNPTCFVGAVDGSSLLVDVSSSIRFNPFLTSPVLYSEISPSGYLSYRAVSQKDTQTNPSYLDNYVSDSTNIITDLFFTRDSAGTPYENSWIRQSGFAQAQGTVKAENLPVLGLRVENSFSLNINDYANFDKAIETISPARPQTQTLLRTGSPTNQYTECFPYVSLARVIGLNAPTTQQAPYEFNPGFFLAFRKNQSFQYPFFRDLESTDNPNDFDKFIFNGVGRFKVSGRNDSFFQLHGRIHFLGSPRYRELALQFNQTPMATLGGGDIPVDNDNPGTSIVTGDFGCAIIEMYKDPIFSTASFDIGSSETCTLSLEGVLYLKGDTYYP